MAGIRKPDLKTERVFIMQSKQHRDSFVQIFVTAPIGGFLNLESILQFSIPGVGVVGEFVTIDFDDLVHLRILNGFGHQSLILRVVPIHFRAADGNAIDRRLVLHVGNLLAEDFVGAGIDMVMARQD